MIEVKIESQYIKLDQFLKHVGLVQTGGQAKILISQGQVAVNKNISYERGKKIRKDDIIEVLGDKTYIVT